MINKFKLLMKRYEDVFLDILDGMKFGEINRESIFFRDDNNNKMIARMVGNFLVFDYESKYIDRHIIFSKGTKNYGLAYAKVTFIIKEKRDKGCIVEITNKIYNTDNWLNMKMEVCDLISKRYVLDRNISDSYNLDEDYLENNCLINNVFESHIINSKEKVCTLLNGFDISYLFEDIDCIDKISVIFDLYNGIINKRNIEFINVFSVWNKCFGYRDICGITRIEDNICGKINNKDNTKLLYLRKK